MVRSKKTKNTSETEISDKNKTVNDWGKLTKEILTLKCNNYSIIETGTKLDLQKRLVEHFNTNDDVTMNNINEQQTPRHNTDDTGGTCQTAGNDSINERAQHEPREDTRTSRHATK